MHIFTQLGNCAWQYTVEQKRCDVDHLAALVLEVVPDHSCLVFCPTKKNCENVARLVCKFMSKLVDSNTKSPMSLN